MRTPAAEPGAVRSKRRAPRRTAAPPDCPSLWRALEALHRGDFAVRLRRAPDVPPRVAKAFNALAARNQRLCSELVRLSTAVGKQGVLTQRASIGAAPGGWARGVDSVNSLVADLVQPTSQMARVIEAVAEGDLSRTMPLKIERRRIKGEFLRTARTVNRMVGQLGTFASEVTRVAREVGTEGKLGGQARVRGVAGTWKDLTDNVNSMAANLTSQVRNIAEVTKAVARGDLSKKITVGVQGEILELKDTINTLVDRLGTFASEVTRVAREVGTQGRLGGQARVEGVAGTWKDLTDNVNSLADNLTSQVRNIADVTKAVASGDLSKKITVSVRGEVLELKNTVNTMVDQLNAFAGEVTRVAREVGTEGKLGGQARVKGVAGTWKDLTDNVNSMAENLTSQVRNIAEVTKAVARGDLSTKITVDVKGEILELKDTINTLVDRLGTFASEVTRVAREVGTEGKLGGQARVEGVAGTWKDLTDNVNSLADNLTSQVRNIADVTTAVARGDLSKKITVAVKGEVLELKDTINTMVDQLNAFASEVTRVAREVGTEGKLGGQARVKGVGGTWKDLTDNVNSMAANLTSQVRNIAEVTKAVARGDLSKKITVDVKGEILELKDTVNTLVDRLGTFASEVTRVAREVGTEGKLGGQARVEGVAGTWKGLTDNVNSLAANLTSQVRNIAEVTKAVARGDLSHKITVDVKGEILELKNTVNTMVDQLNAFASEVTRVAREVGTEGKLGGQALVRGEAGIWKDLTENVNSMAANLTSQVRNIADVTTAVARGDLSRKVTVEVKGEILELKNTINTMVDQLNAFASEVTRVAREVGTDGRLGGQAYVRGVGGTWKDLTDNVNSMADNLTGQVRNIAEVTKAVANGDLSRKITVDVRGEILELKNTINTMVDQLNAFASEVTRVAREVGTDGKLGGQAMVRGVAGIWKDLTDKVNTMADNLTAQVRGIARVVTAVANGDLKRKLVLEAKGEIAILADTINGMIETLATFADQVSGVAREVGVEGRLGGQAEVPGAAGTWRDLTDNVNRLAANLTTQVRAIAEVATAVTEGDLTRSVAVEARGEVAALKDNINEMIGNLKETTQKNQEQDWLNSNLARFGRMLQGQRDLETVSRTLLSELSGLVSAHQGLFYVLESGNEARLTLRASYATTEPEQERQSIALGEGLIGQCAVERERILLRDTPPEYLRVSSGLGRSAPLNVAVLPVLFEGRVKAVIELASMQRFSEIHLAFLEQLMESIGIVLNTIGATMQTEDLLRQSQLLTERLRAQQEELQKTNEELAEKARLLMEQKAEVEVKNREVELASRALEEKAEQLSMTSKYKSEFLANMSHELRTPLNSVLILAKLLADDPEGLLTTKQVEFAETIHSCGRDLLSLINEILDLSKIESGTMVVDVGEVSLEVIAEFAERGFRPLAETRNLGFAIDLDPSLPRTVKTDSKRLQQVLRNLLSNAFKFTERGQVDLRIFRATSGWSEGHPVLSEGTPALAFEVTDTGIGIPRDKQGIVFEAFQQVDGTTSRKHGGTGLGLSISREIARLLGGEIRLESEPGRGSTFTLFLPMEAPGGHVDAARLAPAEAVAVGAPARPPALRAHAPASASARARPEPLHVERAEAPRAEDDREEVGPGDRVVLVVDDDAPQAAELLEAVREHGWRAVVAPDVDSALGLARRHPPVAVWIDIQALGVPGWTLLDRIKHDPTLRHVPVHVLGGPDGGDRARMLGAQGYLELPASVDTLGATLARIEAFVDRSVRRLLVVEDDERERLALSAALSAPDVDLTSVGTGKEALERLRAETYDCVILDLSLPDIPGESFLASLRSDPELRDLPVVIHTGMELSAQEASRLERLAGRLVRKGVDSVERLAAHTGLYLHRTEAGRQEPTRRTGKDPVEADPLLVGRTVLIVDDDVRNVFAITSILERQRVKVRYATNGREAIQSLKADPRVDAVLMDIMMPEMDGHQTTREIRKLPAFAALPIIALTARAMQGDREKCLDAGCSDYLAKPVETDQLLSMLRVWVAG